jgi:tetratricopeptide (TPR) repeat protein
MFTNLLALELGVHAAAWDLSGVKHIAERIEPLAARYAGWVPFRHLAEGHHRRLSGDLEGASRAYARCMNLVDPTQRGTEPAIMAWPLATSGYVEVLVARDRAEEARACAERVLQVCQARGVQASCHDVERALALAQAKLGDYAIATRRLDHLLARQQELGVSGLNLGATYETRARVAIWAGDADAFERIGRLAAQEYRHGEGSPLGVRYERLIEEARRAGIAAAPALKPAAVAKPALTTWGARIAAIQNIRDPAGRAERALEILCEASGSDAGHLLLADSAGLHWASSYGALSPSLELQQRAGEFWDRRNSPREADRPSASEPFWKDVVGTSFRPVLLAMQNGRQLGVALISRSENDRHAIDPALLAEVARVVSL